MNITTVGIDLAKNVFQVHGVDERCKAQLRKQLKRTQMMNFFVNLPPCHDWNGGLRQRSFLGTQAGGVRAR